MKSLLIMSAGIALTATTVSTTAFADPPEGRPASCLGYEASDVSPPGSEDGPFSQFGMPGILAFIDVIIAGTPLNRGNVIRVLAHLHEGSHEACDEAVGVPPEVE